MAEFKDLLLKIAQNRQLTPLELDELGRFGTETQQRNAQIANTSGLYNNIDVDSITAKFGNFDVPPVRGISLIGGVSLSVSLSTPTAIPFTTVLNKSNTSSLVLDSSDNTKLIPYPGAGGSFLVCFGVLNWSTSNPNGQAIIYQYDAGGSVLDAFTMGSFTAQVLPFIGGFTVQSTTSYIQVRANQQTASPATLNVARVSFFEII